MRVLMFGWEFPPYKSGGLGTACYGITRALAEKGVEVLFMLPHMEGKEQLNLSQGLTLREADGTKITWEETVTSTIEHRQIQTIQEENNREISFEETINILGTSWEKQMAVAYVQEVWKEKLKIFPIQSLLHAYANSESYAELQSYWQKSGGTSTSFMYDPHTMPLTFLKQATKMVSEKTSSELLQIVEETQKTINRGETVLSLHGGYGNDLMAEVFRYSQSVLGIKDEQFDVIHAHEWMTCPAAIVAKHLSGKPLIVHIHALESDRSGVNLNHEVSVIEKAGLEAADSIVTVSHYTKTRITELYGIDPNKISVVHNALTQEESRAKLNIPLHNLNEKYVLFMGRITFQKGPEYFIKAAKLVLDRMPNVRFIMAGSGDMMRRMVRMVAQMRMGSRFHFAGFLQGEDVDRMYAMSDLYVMPSVSEPFGIAPLEAMAYDTPVLISKQSGVAEVVKNALKVDFWDVQAMADKICAVLANPRLAKEMVKNCKEELKHIRWENAANKLITIYENSLSKK